MNRRHFFGGSLLLLALSCCRGLDREDAESESPETVASAVTPVTAPCTKGGDGRWGLLEGSVPMKSMYYFPGSLLHVGPGRETFSYWPADCEVVPSVPDTNAAYCSRVADACAPSVPDGGTFGFTNFHDPELCPAEPTLNLNYPSTCGELRGAEIDPQTGRSFLGSTVDKITAAGVNVISLSYWNNGNGTYCQPYCDDLWTVQSQRAFKIIPLMDGIDTPTVFGARGDTLIREAVQSAVRRWLRPVANGPLAATAGRWQQVYDRSGTLRYAVELLNVASYRLAHDRTQSMDDEFVHTLDAIADDILAADNVRIGFLVDPGGGPGIPAAPEPDSAMSTYTPSAGATCFERAGSFLGIMGWRNEWQTPRAWVKLATPPADVAKPTGNADMLLQTSHIGFDNNLGLLPNASGDHYRERVARSKWVRSQEWINQGYPVILDVSPGYDGHNTWRYPGYRVGDDGKDQCVPPGDNDYVGDNGYGFDDAWRNYLSEMKGFGNVGITYDSWNGFGEGMTAMPGYRKPGRAVSSVVKDENHVNTRYDWVRYAYGADPRICDHWHFVDGHPKFHVYGDICKAWQSKGGQLGVDPHPYPTPNPNSDPGRSYNDFKLGEPVSSVVPSPGGNLVGRFGTPPSADYRAFYFKNSSIGAHEVRGSIYAKYKSIGEDASYLGAPTSDEIDNAYWCAGGKTNSFEHGWIEYCPNGNVWAHSGSNEGYPGHDHSGPVRATGLNKCLSVQFSPSNGSPMVTWDCVNGANEMWDWDAARKTIRSTLDTTKCLDVRTSTFANGTPVVAWTCSGLATQQWDFIGTTFHNRGTAAAKCLTGQYTAGNGQPVVIWDCVPNAGNQQFTHP